MIERRLEIAGKSTAGGSSAQDVIRTEIVCSKKLEAMLNAEKPLRHYTIHTEEDKVVASFGFLSRNRSHRIQPV